MPTKRLEVERTLPNRYETNLYDVNIYATDNVVRIYAYELKMSDLSIGRDEPIFEVYSYDEWDRLDLHWDNPEHREIIQAMLPDDQFAFDWSDVDEWDDWDTNLNLALSAPAYVRKWLLTLPFYSMPDIRGGAI